MSTLPTTSRFLVGLLNRQSLIAIGAALVAGACGSTTTTPSSSSTTTTRTPVTESWTGTVPVGGASFYSFSISQSGSVRLTLQSVGGQDVPPTATLGLAIGTPNGTSCAHAGTTNTQAGPEPQVTATYDPGLYCANVSDVGELTAPATVTVIIGHP